MRRECEEGLQLNLFCVDPKELGVRRSVKGLDDPVQGDDVGDVGALRRSYDHGHAAFIVSARDAG